MKPNLEHENRPSIPNEFVRLDETFFSIGQDETYYQNLNSLGADLRNQILESLRDLAFDDANLTKALNEPVMKSSLLRGVALQSIKGRFRRLSRGAARSTKFKFSFQTVSENNTDPLLSFEVEPYSEPPTNLHVLIGRNGVGKTHCLTMMARTLVSRPTSQGPKGVFYASIENEDEGLFANVVSVAFSAFDPFESLPTPRSKVVGLDYSYIGLRQIDDDTGKWIDEPKNIKVLTREFLSAVKELSINDEAIHRWRQALRLLESDPVFKDYDVSSLAFDVTTRSWFNRGRSLFGSLSSGHKIVLLTITKLIVNVTERTLVLIDEPESHLHPPLLSALMRSLSDLLIHQNGVAIIATHSPVVLQEVPKSCVWKLRRTGQRTNAERPDIETFGENVGILTREVFGLEVTESGFHNLIQEAVNDSSSYESILESFGGQLGEEARAILRAKLAMLISNSKTL